MITRCFRTFLLAGLCSSMLFQNATEAQAGTICNENCDAATIDGTFYDLVLNYLADEGDDIDLTVDGNIYIRGPLFIAPGGMITLTGGAVIINTEINIEFNTDLGGGDSGGSGGAIFTTDLGGDLTAADSHPDPNVMFNVIGDVYLDAANIELANLNVTASGTITFGIEPVPEPGAGAMLGFGLIGLARLGSPQPST
ncbi:MAG: PEP-CTERM sorting domain-containing protein [Myxococcales bacterium]|nr:PEP-CTERM sorting domain-containing protein [Myxococcales bacterium]